LPPRRQHFSRAYPIPPINLAERDYFKAHLNNPGLGDFISQPVRNKGNGKWTFYISRRLNDEQGQFLGLVLVGISVEVPLIFMNGLPQSGRGGQHQPVPRRSHAADALATQG
jgi:hypothetical protein